jgi:hypothetical protein
MFRQSRALLLLLAPLLTGQLQSAQRPATPSESVSPYLGKLVTHPEALSGVWEASNGQGAAVGIHLQLDTWVSGEATTLNGTPQYWQGLEVQVYERHGSTIKIGDGNYFSDSRRGGNVSLEQGRLTLHSVSSSARLPQVDLDLTQETGDQWSGRFHRGNFDSRVVLRRPAIGRNGETNAITGTWFHNSMGADSCLHIVEQTPHEFTGWSDSLRTPGKTVAAPNIPRQAQVFQRYGELAKVHVEKDGRIFLELSAYTGVCCPRKFVGTITGNAPLLKGAWQSGPNSTHLDASWQKLSGDSCIAPSSPVL